MPDPRDRALDHLLRRQLSADAGTPDACPDAESLAAWMDHALDTAGTSAIEAHAASCARCQATMAALVRSAEAAGSGAQPAGSRGVETRGGPDRGARPPDVESLVPPQRRHALVRWLAPLTAAAAVVLIYVLVPGEGPMAPASSPESTQARAQGAVAAEAAEADRALAPTAPSSARATGAAEPVPGVAAADPAAQADTFAKGGPRAPLEATTPGPDVMTGRAAEALRGVPASPAPSPAAGAPAAVDLQVSRERRMENTLAAAGIRSADAAVRWRFAGPRAVERSVDGGATWTRLDTDAPDDLLAGASPSAQVCWLAGRQGVVLRSVDGRAWQVVTRPTTDDLIAVDARDAATATVRTADGRGFHTSDGGGTWVAVP